MPKISIIMPLYNGAEYLRKAIESIQSQTYQNWEMLIINEYGSNDGSKEIVEEYAKYDYRIKLIQNTERLGIAESMNVGIRAAEGEYIARMDADDISLPTRLEKQLKYMEQHTDIAMCGVKVEIFGSDPFEWELETRKEFLATNILFYSPSVHPTVMIRKSFMDEYHIEYNKEYKASEDYDLFSQICEYGKVVNLDEVLFRYRIMKNNTTFKNNDIGMVIYNQVMERQFIRLGLSFKEEELRLLSPHYSLKGMSGLDVIKALLKLDLLLKKIFAANDKVRIYNPVYLWKTLHKRFRETVKSTEWFCKDFDRSKVEQLYARSVFSKENFYLPKQQTITNTPKVTVLMPTYNSEEYIMGALWSVLEQSFQDFEILIINEWKSDDDTLYIAEMFHDQRIRIIQNKEKKGLAESLNIGMREAKGEYIARLDADDLCHKDRLASQVKFLDENIQYGVCGSWQHHFGVNTEWIHKCSVSYEDIQAELIFNCDLCHSTLMLRKDYFIQNELFYDSSYAAEDYELWIRAIQKFKIANLPIVLGEYRVGESNITAKKMDSLSLESGQLVARNIEYYFGFHLSEEMTLLQSGWRNEFDKLPADRRKKALEEEKSILRKMWRINQKNKRLNESSLLKTINRRWRSITNTYMEDGEVYSIEDLLKKFDYNHVNVIKMKSTVEKITFKKVIKRILQKPYYALKYRTVDVILKNIWDADGHAYDYYSKLMQEGYDIDGHNYDYYSRLLEECQDINRYLNGVQNMQDASTHNILLSIEQLEKKINLINKNVTAFESDTRDSMIKFVDAIKEAVIENQVNEKKLLEEMNGTWQLSVRQIHQRMDDKLSSMEKKINEVIDTRVWKAEQTINETTDARVWKAEQNVVEMQRLLAELLFKFKSNGKKIILINTPTHDNLGDHAIAYAEICWLKDNIKAPIVEITGNMYREYGTIIRKFISEDDVIAISGGGYLGSLWEYEEDLVEQIIQEYPNNAIRVFPQSVYFTENESGKTILERAKQVYQNHTNFILYVREELSYQFVKANFPKVDVRKACDMVFYLYQSVDKMLGELSMEKSGVALCLKGDKESVLSDKDKSVIEKVVEEMEEPLFYTDTITRNDIDESKRYEELSNKLKEFAGYKYMITDRFHGILFSVLTGTPCIAVKGVSYKNKGICEMLGEDSSVFYVDKIEDIGDAVVKLGLQRAGEIKEKIKEIAEKELIKIKDAFLG